MIAAGALVAAIVLVSTDFNPAQLSLLSSKVDLEIEQAFINHIAIYGRTYASKSEI